MGWGGGPCDFSVTPSPNWTWIFYFFGFGIGIGSRGTGVGTRAWQFDDFLTLCRCVLYFEWEWMSWSGLQKLQFETFHHSLSVPPCLSHPQEEFVPVFLAELTIHSEFVRNLYHGTTRHASFLKHRREESCSFCDNYSRIFCVKNSSFSTNRACHVCNNFHL